MPPGCGDQDRDTWPNIAEMCEPRYGTDDRRNRDDPEAGLRRHFSMKEQSDSERRTKLYRVTKHVDRQGNRGATAHERESAQKSVRLISGDGRRKGNRQIAKTVGVEQVTHRPYGKQDRERDGEAENALLNFHCGIVRFGIARGLLRTDIQHRLNDRSELQRADEFRRHPGQAEPPEFVKSEKTREHDAADKIGGADQRLVAKRNRYVAPRQEAHDEAAPRAPRLTNRLRPDRQFFGPTMGLRFRSMPHAWRGKPDGDCQARTGIRL